jgi:cathepsin B
VNTISMLSLLVLAVLAGNAHALSQEQIVEAVNAAHTSWKAGVNFGGADPSDLQYLMGTFVPEDTWTSPAFVPPQVAVIPETFDARVAWPECPTIREIRDQSACGSCWAFGAVEAMSDRICIFSNASTVVQISAQDMISCGSGVTTLSFGCNGGQPRGAWKYYVNQGVVTGGLYEGEGCQPYFLPPCNHHVTNPDYPDCPEGIAHTPECEKTCVSGYPLSFQQDKYYGQDHYTIARNISAIQAEILVNGPVEADFTVYEDFLTYQSGVYVHTNGTELGGHAIRMLGWGVEDGTPYWLCANSWNSGWGEDGYFKILRGVNECGIENDINAGIPLTL